MQVVATCNKDAIDIRKVAKDAKLHVANASYPICKTIVLRLKRARILQMTFAPKILYMQMLNDKFHDKAHNPGLKIPNFAVFLMSQQISIFIFPLILSFPPVNPI